MSLREAGAGPSAEWTLLLYMAGVKGGLLRAETRLMRALAGSFEGSRVHVVYQINTGQETRRGRIRGGDPKPEVLLDGPRVNAADPAALTSFLDWALLKYPSRYTALVLKGHGGGLDRPPTSGLPAAGGTAHGAAPAPPHPREILDDPVTNEYLGVGGLRQGIERAVHPRLGARRIDVCGLDACDMGLLEVAYELRAVTDYVVATQSIEPATAWPYRQSIDALCEGDPMGPRALAALLATANRSAFLGAYDLGWVEELGASVDAVGDRLTQTLWQRRGDVEALRGLLTSFGVENQYVDLKQLFDALDRFDQDGRPLFDQARVDLARTCFAKVPMVLSGGARAGGLSIFFPRRSGSTYLASYGALDFARKNRWAGMTAEFCFPSPGV